MRPHHGATMSAGPPRTAATRRPAPARLRPHTARHRQCDSVDRFGRDFDTRRAAHLPERPLQRTQAAQIMLARKRSYCGNNVGAESRTVEDPVMADFFLQMMRLHVTGKIAAEPVRRTALPKAGDIVIFAFHRHQRHTPDRPRVAALAAIAHASGREGMIDEDLLHRVQIVFGAHIHHRQIFIVELTVLLGRVAIALDQIEKQLAMGADMPVEFIDMKPVSCRKPG